MHVFITLWCFFEELTNLATNKASPSKTNCKNTRTEYIDVNEPLLYEDSGLLFDFAQLRSDVATAKRDVWVGIQICFFAINTLRAMTKILMKRTSDRMLWVEWIKMNTIFTDLFFRLCLFGESATFSSLSTVVTLVGEVSGSQPGCRGEV